MTRLRRHLHWRIAAPALAQRSGRLEVASIEARQRVFRRRLDHRAERARHAELYIVNGAEWGGKRRLQGAVDQRLMRDQRGKVLIADLARQQQQYQDAEREG